MKKLRIALSLVGALAVASSASASVTLELVSVGQPGMNNYQTVHLQAGSPVNINQSGVEAGFYNLLVDGVATPAFCIDIATDQHVGLPLYTDYNYTPLASAPTSVAGPMGATAAANIEKLWAAYYTDASSSSVKAAALQVAIWEVVAAGTGTYTLTVSGNSDVTSQATTYYNSLGSLTAQADLVALTDNGQAYVVPVPEARSLIAGALLLLPLGASTLRILRKSRMA